MPSRTAILAARSGTKHLDLVAQADDAGERADRALTRAWNALIRLLEKPPHYIHFRQAIRAALANVYAALHAELERGLTGLAWQGHRDAADILAGALPLDTLASRIRLREDKDSVRDRLLKALRSAPKNPGTGYVEIWRVRQMLPDVGFAEFDAAIKSLPPVWQIPISDLRELQPHQLRQSVQGVGELIAYVELPPEEAEPTPPTPPASVPPSPQEPPRKKGLRFRMQAGQLKVEPSIGGSAAHKRQLMKQLVFEPPSKERVAEILRRPVLGLNWEQDLAAASKLAGYDPDRMAMQLALGYSLGRNVQQLTKDILPAVDGVRKSARRIARTYGVQVARTAQMQAHQQLGDLVIGYQIHSAFSPHSRDWHMERDGEIYYLNPESGQKGPAQMPNPPLEAEDPRERPPGTPRMAWH